MGSDPGLKAKAGRPLQRHATPCSSEAAIQEVIEGAIDQCDPNQRATLARHGQLFPAGEDENLLPEAQLLLRLIHERLQESGRLRVLNCPPDGVLVPVLKTVLQRKLCVCTDQLKLKVDALQLRSCWAKWRRSDRRRQPRLVAGGPGPDGRCPCCGQRWPDSSDASVL